MKHLPWLFGGIHALFAACVFGSALFYPARAGLLPIVVFVADVPVSFLIEWAASFVGGGSLNPGTDGAIKVKQGRNTVDPVPKGQFRVLVTIDSGKFLHASLMIASLSLGGNLGSDCFNNSFA